jgi:hypothetical protein
VPWFRFSALAIAVARLGAAVPSPPGELRDLAPPVEMPDDPVWHFYLAGAVCVVLIAAALVFVVRRRRPVPVVRPVPPQQAALQALRELENAAREPKDFYTRLVEILRAYIAGRFAIEEPDATASELLSALFKTADLAAEHQRLLRGIVSESDLVKFAARLPPPGAPARALCACREFVHETAVQEEAAAHAL